MQLILCENIDKLGKKGEVIDVSRGYARNFLLPRKLAMEVNDNNVMRMGKEMKLVAAKHGDNFTVDSAAIVRLDVVNQLCWG